MHYLVLLNKIITAVTELKQSFWFGTDHCILTTFLIEKEKFLVLNRVQGILAKVHPWVQVILTKVHVFAQGILSTVHVWEQGILNKILLTFLFLEGLRYIHAPVC